MRVAGRQAGVLAGAAWQGWLGAGQAGVAYGPQAGRGWGGWGVRIWQVGWLAGVARSRKIRRSLSGPSLVNPLARWLGRQAQKRGALRLP